MVNKVSEMLNMGRWRKSCMISPKYVEEQISEVNSRDIGKVNRSAIVCRDLEGYEEMAKWLQGGKRGF